VTSTYAADGIREGKRAIMVEESIICAPKDREHLGFAAVVYFPLSERFRR